MRNTAIATLEQALPEYLAHTALLTDEAEDITTGLNNSFVVRGNFVGSSLDARILPEGTSAVTDYDYRALQHIRGAITQALGALTAYDTIVTDTTGARLRRGELYALLGYSDILLADLFCSGVPLSTLDFQRDFTYHASSTTAAVYQAALAATDTALALASGSDTVANMARVIRGRALLALGQYAQAAQVVAPIGDGFAYRLGIQWTSSNPADPTFFFFPATVSDSEGRNGFLYRSEDPRITTTLTSSTNPPAFFPNRYSLTGFSPFPLADWIEARLIQAEAALQAHDTTRWLALLNTLRRTATIPGQATTPLDSLPDPGSDTARVSLTFRDRAFWLYMTGHRQGDLRRLIRQYGRPEQQVYPTGQYLGQGPLQYGGDVTAPIPADEYLNPLFHGCLDRGA